MNILPGTTKGTEIMAESSFLKKIKDVAVGLATLKVTTCIGDIQAKRPDADSPGLTRIVLDWDPAATQILRTEVDLVAGDANNFVHEKYDGDGAATVMREYHERQVARSQDIVQRNIELMMRLGEKFPQLLQQDGQP